MQTTGKKVITRVLGLTYAPCMDTYTNMKKCKPKVYLLATSYHGYDLSTLVGGNWQAAD